MQRIEEKLGSVFKSANIDDKLKSSSSTVLNQKIEFTMASKPQSSFNDMLKDKYVNLAPSVKKSTSSGSIGDDGEGLPQPTEVLFSPDKLDYRWRFPEGGAGLMNCGNTCFLNATLQCLVHTPPLSNYLLSGHHFSQCKLYSREKCILCNLQMLMKRSLTGAADSFSPKWFINNLQFIGRHFRNGRQEDAHEFLRLSLEKMQKCALFGFSHLDKYSKETTVINQIFGGFLRSQVVCLRCKHRSNTYDPLLDISLDIKNVDSIERALQQFVAPDKLDMDNAYKCEKCKQKVTALKRFTIHKPPNVLTIQLKRFQFAQSSFFGGGGKISKHIKYPARLNIRDYMSKKNGPPEMYSLFATIQHEGYSCQSGHYVANVRCGERWYHFNDSVKRRTSLQHCLNESSAYVLFYIREAGLEQQKIPPTPPVPSDLKVKHQNGNGSLSTSNKFIGPVRPQMIKTPERASFKPVNGSHGTPSNDVGSPFKPVPLSSKRDRISISFGVKTPSKPKDSQKPSSPKRKLENQQTPRLVMKIKDGKSITIETSPDGEKRILSDDDEVIAKMNERKSKKFIKRSRLVPYGDESSSDSDFSNRDSSPVQSVKLNGHKKNEVIFDQKLNATTSVPGNSHLYETVAMKDKISHTSHQSQDKQKDYKPGLPKAAHTSPIKRQLSENLSCVTSPTPAKHTGGSDWLTTVDSVLSPSVGSSHSSTHSNNSTSDWSVSKNAVKTSSSAPDRQTASWTVTPSGKTDHTVRRSYSEGYVRNDSVEKDHAGYAKPPTNMKRQVMQEKLKSEEILKSGGYPSPVDVSDKAHLLSPDRTKDALSEECRQIKKAKKHKKHKKHRHEDREYKYSELSDDTSHSHKKKKKKRKHKHRDRDEERDEDNHISKHKHSHDRDEYRAEEEKKASKRKHGKDREEEGGGKRNKQDSDSSAEFEWVEKKVEKPAYTSSSVPATPSQSWDHHIKDGYRVSKSGTNTPVKSSWDGLKMSKVVSELESLSSYGYGAPVSGWDGNRSKIDKDRQKDLVQRKRTSDDEYEEELDQGRVKKIKHKHSGEHRHNGNIFQEEQDRRNKSKINWSSLKVGEVSFNKHNNSSSSSHGIHHRLQ